MKKLKRAEQEVLRVKIDKGIKIPPSKTHTYPWGEMNVGDSFFIKTIDKDLKKVQNSLLDLSKQYCIRNNVDKKFSTRRIKGGIRMWRIS